MMKVIFFIFKYTKLRGKPFLCDIETCSYSFTSSLLIVGAANFKFSSNELYIQCLFYIARFKFHLKIFKEIHKDI